MTTNDFVKPADKIESVDPKAAPIERTAAAQESTTLLNNSDSLPILIQGSVVNPTDAIQPLALVDNGHDVPADEHFVHHAPGHEHELEHVHGHGHGHVHVHRTHDSSDQTTTASTDVTAQKPALAADALSDPAIMARLAQENPGLAAQLAMQNPAMATLLVNDNPGLALQLASQNPALAAQLAAQNPAMEAQLVAQGLIAKKTEA